MNPFALSLSKGSTPFALSLSKGFDRLSPNGVALPDRAQAADLLRALQARPHLRQPAATTEPVVLYGAGELGQLAIDWCRQYGANVLAVVDAGAERWRHHPAWQGVQVLHPDEVPHDWLTKHRLLVCISTLPWRPLAASLHQRGWQTVQPFYDFAHAWPQAHPLNNGWHARLPRSGAANDALHGVMAGWADDTSRAHHLQFLAWRCLREEITFDGAPIDPAQRYFTPEFQAAFRPGERLLDGGAHQGQMTRRFLAEHPGWLDHAWLVEPDPGHQAQLATWRATLPAAHQARIRLHALALAPRAGNRRWVTGQGYGCRLWAGGGLKVPAKPLDALDWSPSIVKLHLEGAEWPALQGAAQTLARTRPLLALTVYHQRDGLFDTAHWLARALPRYRWLFRLYGWLGTAAVVYGIPQER